MKSQGFIFDDYSVGGIHNVFRQQIQFAGINETQIQTTSVVMALAGTQFNFTGNLFLLARANSAFYNFSNETSTFTNGKWINGFSLGLGYNLAVLPMEFNVMYSPEVNFFYQNIKIGFLF
jgi:NTE family protein